MSGLLMAQASLEMGRRIAALEAENERLHTTVRSFVSRILMLEAENKCLRGELEYIEWIPQADYWISCPCCDARIFEPPGGNPERTHKANCRLGAALEEGKP